MNSSANGHEAIV